MARKDIVIWYAVQEETTDAWDYGSYDLQKAVEMLKAQGRGLIAVIDEENGVCLREIAYNDAVEGRDV